MGHAPHLIPHPTPLTPPSPLLQAEREERLANIMPEPDDDADKDGDKPAEPEASSPPSPPETPPAGDGDKPSGGDDDKPDEPPLAMA